MEDKVKITLRLPSTIHESLVARAERDRRSLNSTVVLALEQFVAEDAVLEKKRVQDTPKGGDGE